MIPNIYFIIIQGIIGAYLTFLTTKGGFTDERKSGSFRKLTLRGKKAIMLIIIIILVGLFQDRNNVITIKRKDDLLKEERDARDSILAKKMAIATDSMSKVLYRDISADFLQQVLKLDTVKGKVANTYDNVVQLNQGINEQKFVLENMSKKTDETYRTNISSNKADSPIIKMSDSGTNANFDSDGNLNINVKFMNHGVRTATEVKIFYQVLYAVSANNGTNSHYAYLVGQRGNEDNYYPKQWSLLPKGQDILPNSPRSFGKLELKPKLTKKDFHHKDASWTILLSLSYRDGNNGAKKIKTLNVMGMDYKNDRFTIIYENLNLKSLESFFEENNIRDFIEIE